MKKREKPAKVKNKSVRWRRLRRWIVFILILALAAGGYWYYAFEYRAGVEPESAQKTTNTDPVYTAEQYEKTIQRNRTMYEYVCEEEIPYVIPGLKSTRTLQIRTSGTLDICTSMTPQGLAVTEDYMLISAYCRTGKRSFLGPGRMWAEWHIIP